MARLCSLSEGKDRRCSSYEGDVVDQTNQPSACVIDPAMDLDAVKPLKAAKSINAVKLAKSMKPVASTKPKSHPLP